MRKRIFTPTFAKRPCSNLGSGYLGSGLLSCGVLGLVTLACSPSNSAGTETSPTATSPVLTTTASGPGSAAPGDTTSPASSTSPGPEGTSPAGTDPLFGGGVPTISVGPEPTSTAGEGGDDGTEVEEDVNPIVPCDVATGSGETPLIDDFEDGDLETLVQDGREASWYVYNSEDSDTQTLELVADDSAPSGGGQVLHSAGSGFEWAGVGVGLRWGYADENEEWIDCAYDATAYTGVRFWARGSAQVRFTASVLEVIPLANGGTCDELQGACWDQHGVDLVFTDEWQLYEIPFADMVQLEGSLGALDPSRIRTMELQTGSQAVFELWLDNVGFISDSAPIDDAPVDDVVVDDEPMDDVPVDDEPMDDVPVDDEPTEPDVTEDAGAVDASPPPEPEPEADASVSEPSNEGGT